MGRETSVPQKVFEIPSTSCQVRLTLAPHAIPSIMESQIPVTAGRINDFPAVFQKVNKSM